MLGVLLLVPVVDGVFGGVVVLLGVLDGVLLGVGLLDGVPCTPYCDLNAAATRRIWAGDRA